jgi:hypothetical protein
MLERSASHGTNLTPGDRGTDFYFLGIAAFASHDYQTATFFFDAAASEAGAGMDVVGRGQRPTEIRCAFTAGPYGFASAALWPHPIELVRVFGQPALQLI